MSSHQRGLTPLKVSALGAILVAIAAGCNGEDPAGPQTFNPPPPVTVRSLRLSPDRATHEQGDRFTMVAVQVMSDGSEIPAPVYNPALPASAQVVQWMSSNSSVMTVNSATGEVVAVGTGDVQIQARMSASVVGNAVLTVVPVTNSATAGALTATGFSVTEFQYPGGRDWSYAPELRVFAAPGRQVRLLSLQLTIPGISRTSLFGCTASVTSAAKKLNGDFYGEWHLYLEVSGEKSNGEDATAVLTFVDDTETMRTLTIKGPVLTGAMPNTYGQPGLCYTGG